MSESGLSTSAAMLFERDNARVLEAFRRGEFDYVDAIGEVSEADFFRVITERKILDKLAQSYPSPRERHVSQLHPFSCFRSKTAAAFGFVSPGAPKNSSAQSRCHKPMQLWAIAICNSGAPR